MQARGLLMIEHRLIERMLSVIRGLVKRIEVDQRTDPALVDAVADFMLVYADQTHHGKEEDILFRDLKNKPLSPEDRQLMNELIEDHVSGRRLTKALVDANTRYRNGDETALSEIKVGLQNLVKFYPGHIEKEDKVFFPVSRVYLSDEEDQAMLGEFREFDRKMIHEKYKSVVEQLEG